MGPVGFGVWTMTIALHPLPRLPGSSGPARPLRLGVLTPHNPYDQRAFSGTVFHAVRALTRQPGLDLTVIGPHRPRGRFDRLLRRPPERFEPSMLAPDGSDFDGLDAVVGLVASALLDEALMLTDLPLLHVTDATPGFLGELYRRTIPPGVRDREARILEGATAVYSSRMMRGRAAAEFGLRPSGLRAVPFGVNFSDPPVGLPQKPPLDRLEILFVGGDWERKGGDLALEALERLRAAGRGAHLTLVGNVPDGLRPVLQNDRDVTVTGFLDKNRPRHLDRLQSLFARAHVLVLPSRADCTPMVVAEALAYGTPVLASDVGAIGEMVGAGAGRILPLDATGQDWADTLLDMTADRTRYDMMADAASERTATSLNWENWARSIAGLAAEAVGLPMRAAA